MTQYDAGPGDHSDRPWEVPDRKTRQQARRQRVTLPPWALLAVLVGVVVLLCVGLVLLVQALRGRGEEGTPTAVPEETMAVLPTDAEPTATSISVEEPTEAVSPTATVVLPVGTPVATTPPDQIGPGARVVVTGTAGAGLLLRAEPGRQASVIANAREGTILTVLDGPQEAGGYTWWKLRTPAGQEGWGAANWLILSNP